MAIGGKFLSLVALAALVSGAAFAEPLLKKPQYDTEQLSNFSFGLICPDSEGGVKVEAPDTHLGYIVQREELTGIVATTQKIPMVDGIGFGVWMETELDTLGDITIRLQHPPFKGTNDTDQSWKSGVGNGPTVNFFHFEFEQEKVPGRWVFEAWNGDTRIYQVEFDVVEPDQIPHLKGACMGSFLS